ncbi:unnamed protein product, partial [marine sediment metagenome]
GSASRAASRGVIQNNIIEDCGSAVTYYNYTAQEMRNHITRYNLAIDMDNIQSGANGRGFELNGSATPPGLTTGNMFYYNIAINVVDVAFRETRKDVVKFYNNVAYNVGSGIHAGGYENEYYNNGTVEPGSYFLYWRWDSEGGIEEVLYSDYNGYYPNAESTTEFKVLDAVPRQYFYLNFSDYKSQYSGYNWDVNSLVSDPKFLNASGSWNTGSDFQLTADSSWIDAGTDVGLSVDFGGNPIYGTPDIGAWE